MEVWNALSPAHIKEWINMNDKCVLITGGIRNTGLACAKKFLSEGWTVFITSRNGEEASEKAEELSALYGQNCFGLHYSPRDAKEEIEGLFKQISDRNCIIRCVVCTAADLGLAQDALKVDVDAWENVLLTNVVGYFAPARTAAREMIKANITSDGAIVFIGSINFRDTIPGRSAYVASKGAIYSMTKALALDFAPYGIRVNCIMPGPIWTSRYENDPVKAAKKAEPVPLGRVSRTEEIAESVYFFAGSKSGNATGAGLIIDGGIDSISAGVSSFL